MGDVNNHLPKVSANGRTDEHGSGTRVTRETLLQECRVIVPRFQGCDRRITICTPQSPTTYIALDETGENLGMNRVYKMAPLPADQRIPFVLRAGQFITMAVEAGLGTLTVIDECILDGENHS